MERVTISFTDYDVIQLPFTTVQLSPPTGLTATPVVGGGTFAAGTYFWEVTATTALGETTVSNEASAAIALNGSANLAWTLPVGKVTNIKVYRGTASGTENTLVTTLAGTVSAFTDTNVGAGGSPPAANTATVQDTILLTGAGAYFGYSLAETSGTTAAFVEIQDTANTLSEVRLASAASNTERWPESGIPLYGRLNMHVVSGAVRGIIYVGIPPIC